MKTQDPPIQWPHITIDGEDLEVRFTMRILYRASKSGIDMSKLAGHPTSLAQGADLFALCVAHNFEGRTDERGNAVSAPTGEDWLSRLSSMKEAPSLIKVATEAYVLSNLGPATSPPAAPPTAEKRELPN